MKIAALLFALGAVAALVWIGGEIHRSNCYSAGRTTCSVLPWDGGSGGNHVGAKRVEVYCTNGGFSGWGDNTSPTFCQP